MALSYPKRLAEHPFLKAKSGTLSGQFKKFVRYRRMEHNAHSSSIPRSIWALGAVSFLMKVSSVIIFALSPLFITQVLGASTFIVGLLEGFLEAISFLVRILSGLLSDIIHKRKALIVVGYVFALISRPLLAMATTVGGIFMARTFDRIGNGLDAPSRDALVGDIAPSSIKGACYGLRESLSRAGAFTGSLLAVGLLWLTANNYSIVFWVGTIPTLLALLVLVVFVKDPVSEKFQKRPNARKLRFEDLKNFPVAFWLVLVLSGIYNISNFSGAFLILRTEQTGLDIHLIPLVMVIQNIATTMTAYPAGYLSDRIGKRTMMLCGIGLVIFSNILLAQGQSVVVILSGVLVWGAEMGITQSLLAIFLADVCPATLRGTGFGLFHFVNGIGLIIANALAGWIWSVFSPSWTFYTSALIAGLAALVLPFIHKKAISSLKA